MTGWIVLALTCALGFSLGHKIGYNSGYYDGYWAEEDSDDGQPTQSD